MSALGKGSSQWVSPRSVQIKIALWVGSSKNHQVDQIGQISGKRALKELLAQSTPCNGCQAPVSLVGYQGYCSAGEWNADGASWNVNILPLLLRFSLFFPLELTLLRLPQTLINFQILKKVDFDQFCQCSHCFNGDFQRSLLCHFC